MAPVFGILSIACALNTWALYEVEGTVRKPWKQNICALLACLSFFGVFTFLALTLYFGNK